MFFWFWAFKSLDRLWIDDFNAPGWVGSYSSPFDFKIK